ncbi:MAG: carbohydrate-binding domain-containing protein [Lachnospiraceae bacterium]|nr:carbohydrate-binding domain-containing protein [Lachnospiraceae bacterium]
MSKNKISKILTTVTIYSLLVMTGCGQSSTGTPEPTTLPQETEAPAPTSAAVSESTPVPTTAPENAPAPTETSDPVTTPISEEEWKSNLGTIDLSNLRVSGTGITVDGTIIRITAGGDFFVTGTLENGKIVISTTERVKLRLSNASISCNNDSAIFVEQSDKTFLTMEKGTTNTISSKGTEEAAIYAKDDLEIKGSGTLTVTSQSGHGIKASDDLNIENGTLIITAARDGIHTNETCDISGGTLTITAAKDGIESEENLIIRGGSITITAGGQEYTATGEVTVDENQATIVVK